MDPEKEFIQLIGQHQGIVHKVCSLYMNKEQDKKDLFQEILLAAWKGFKNFRGDAKFTTWLYRVSLNTAITFYRKELRTIETTVLREQETLLSYPAYQPDDQLLAMHQAIAELSGIDKALVMLYLADYDYQEIGSIMGITANNVAVKINRLKIKLKESCKKYV